MNLKSMLRIRILILFSKTNIESNRIINWLGRLSFTVLLTHMVWLKYVPIEKICGASIIVLLIGLVLTCILVYLACTPFIIVLSCFIKCFGN